MIDVTAEVIQQRMDSIEFMRRTGIRADEVSYGYGRAVMPLAGNNNHVNTMYMGAYSVLAEAGAATCCSTVVDFTHYFPVIRAMSIEFLRPAKTDVSAEYRLDDETIARLHAELEEHGRSEYTAVVEMKDEAGTVVAVATGTVTILSPRD